MVFHSWTIACQAILDDLHLHHLTDYLWELLGAQATRANPRQTTRKLCLRMKETRKN